jgi:FdhD protein
VVEAPLEIRVGDESIVVMMRTPGQDEELVTGLLFAEGGIEVADDLLSIDHLTRDDLTREERGNIVVVEPRPGIELMPDDRALVANSSCGLCGKLSIASLSVSAEPVRSAATVTATVISALPETLRNYQPIFHATGAVHAAGLFTTSGDVIVVREDVGRHNAVDKVVGWVLSNKTLPLDDSILCVSGRLSFEIVQKAARAGIPVVVAVSAPSSMAVQIAEQYRVTLCGFTRDGRFNVYSHPMRVQF